MEKELAKAVALLTDAIMVLEVYKVAPAFQTRIEEFIEKLGDDRVMELMRINNQWSGK